MKVTACKLTQALAVFALCTLSAFVTNADAQNQASFIAHKEFAVGLPPTAFAEADLNGDSITDLIITESAFLGPQQVVELLGNSDGSFEAPVVLNTGTLAHPCSRRVTQHAADRREGMTSGQELLTSDNAVERTLPQSASATLSL